MSDDTQPSPAAAGEHPPTKATVVTPFDGVPDGEVWPRSFAKGEEVSGGLAEVAVAEGWAKKTKA